MKMAVYLQGIAPYDKALFQGVSNFGIQVHLLVGGKFVDRPYWTEGLSDSQPFFKVILLDSIRLRIGKYIEYFNFKIFSLFRKERYDFVIVPFGSLMGLLVLFVARLSGSSTISWCGVHRFHITPIRILAEPLIRLCVLLSSHFFAYSNYSKRYLNKEGANPLRIFVLNPNGVDIKKFTPKNNPGNLKERLGINVNRKVVLFVGKLEKEKGAEYVIRSMKIVHDRGIDAHLLIAGVGSQRSYLERLVRELELEKNVTFTGSISNEFINEYYSLCDVHVAPSIITRDFAEPFGLVYQEAMASGKPSIAFDIPAPLREIIVDGETGYLVPERNVRQLADKICELLIDDEKRIRMGCKARERAVKNYDISKVSAKWARVLERLALAHQL